MICLDNSKSNLGKLHIPSIRRHPLRNELGEITQGRPHVDLARALIHAHRHATVLLHPILDKCHALPQ